MAAQPAGGRLLAGRRTERLAHGRAPSTRVRVDGKRFVRGVDRFRVQGVTYGPFPPGPDGHQFPAPERVAADFARMREVGVNAVRTYHVPPEWFFHLADEAGVAVFVDVPWPKHLCFLDSARARADARAAVLRAAKVARDHPSVLALSIGNEIPTDVARWHGPRRVERFLAELTDLVKQADPDRLVTFANFPPTEYLDLSFLDFATFNVYLHDREAFRRYLFRLQNLVGDKPLLLGELGMDTLRHGETEQAEFLAGHLAEARLMGLAGAFVFSWTDEWHTGGHPITDWAFGVTHADRSPKAAYHALREMFTRSPAAAPPGRPRGCRSSSAPTTAGGRSTSACGRSKRLDYPDYEVIVVDDGSTDDTRAILGPVPGGAGDPPAEPGAERGPERRAARRDRRGRRVHGRRLLRRPGLADPPRLPAPADRGGRGRRAEPDPGGRVAGGVRGGQPGPADARAGQRPGGRAHSRVQHGVPQGRPAGGQRLRPDLPQGRGRRRSVLAAAAGRACGSRSPRGRSSGTTAGRGRGAT